MNNEDAPQSLIDRKRAARMQTIDEMPPDLRGLVHEQDNISKARVRIVNVRPTEAGLNDPAFMAFLFDRPLAVPVDHFAARFMEVK